MRRGYKKKPHLTSPRGRDKEHGGIEMFAGDYNRDTGA
jgi:hypothetical protein